MACSAAAVGYLAGMSLEEIVAALEASMPEGGRQEILHSDQGFTVINDAYNANPDSMRASLSLLKAMHVEGRRFAVLGDMVNLVRLLLLLMNPLEDLLLVLILTSDLRG